MGEGKALPSPLTVNCSPLTESQLISLDLAADSLGQAVLEHNDTQIPFLRVTAVMVPKNGLSMRFFA